jgi:hypothetical protein
VLIGHGDRHRHRRRLSSDIGAALKPLRRWLHQVDQDAAGADDLRHRGGRHRARWADLKEVGRIGAKALVYFEISRPLSRW